MAAEQGSGSEALKSKEKLRPSGLLVPAAVLRLAEALARPVLEFSNRVQPGSVLAHHFPTPKVAIRSFSLIRLGNQARSALQYVPRAQKLPPDDSDLGGRHLDPAQRAARRQQQGGSNVACRAVGFAAHPRNSAGDSWIVASSDLRINASSLACSTARGHRGASCLAAPLPVLHWTIRLAEQT